MDEEIQEIEKNQTWDLDIPTKKTPIGVKWVYKTKVNEKGKIKKIKTRLVSKGFLQHPGIDYVETFTLVARIDTIKIILTVATQNKWPIYQRDVKLAFLNGILEEEVYMNQPIGYEIKGQEHMFYKLKKALYGLKQVPRVWYNHIDSYFLNNVFN